MKKIFLSLPMKGRDDCAINKTIESMKRIVTAYFPNEEIKFVHNFGDVLTATEIVSLDTVKRPSLLYLGKAIGKMADCDYIAIINTNIDYILGMEFHGCRIEEMVAEQYGIEPIILKDPIGKLLLTDLYEMAKEKKRIIDKNPEALVQNDKGDTGRYRCKSKN